MTEGDGYSQVVGRSGDMYFDVESIDEKSDMVSLNFLVPSGATVGEFLDLRLPESRPAGVPETFTIQIKEDVAIGGSHKVSFLVPRYVRHRVNE